MAGPFDRGPGQRRGPGRRQVHARSGAHHSHVRGWRAWARTDQGYETGDSVTQYYDNLVAKVVAWGPDRESARRRLLRALAETEVEGIPTTVPAHLAVLAHPDFISVRHSTTWLSEQVDLSAMPAATPARLPKEVPAGAQRKDVEVEVDGRRFEVKVWVPPPGARPAPGAVRPLVGNSSPGAPANGPAPLAAAATGGEVTVPMQGTVVKILVKPGDEVEAGQAVCVLEAMKMENNILSQFAGRVSEVRVEAGDPVGTGDVVVVLAGVGG